MYFIKLFNGHSGYTEYIGDGMLKPNVSHCIEEDHVHYEPIPIINGHEYVDFGLPSGTKWATMNVGAENEYLPGLYFAWGETQGYTASQVGTDRQFTWSDYELGDGGSGSTNMLEYNEIDGKTVLDFNDDAVNVNWGGQWHMPTSLQIMELDEYATVETRQVGDEFYDVWTIGDKSIMFPLTTVAENGEIRSWGESFLWSSTVGWIYEINPEVTESLALMGNSHGSGMKMTAVERYAGLNVRGVVGSDENIYAIIDDDITTSSITIRLYKAIPQNASNVKLMLSQYKNSEYLELETAGMETNDNKTFTFWFNERYDNTPFNCYYFKLKFDVNGKTYYSLKYQTKNCLM